MPIYFSKVGLELKKRQIKSAEEKIKALQKEGADAAGVSYDWHDNPGYEEATRQIDMESALLAKIKGEVKEAKIIEPEEQNQEVLMGATVKLLLNTKKEEFTIGAYGETDPGSGLVSYTSPLGTSLLGMKVGDSKIFVIGNKSSNVIIEKIFPPSYKYNKILKNLKTIA